MTTEAKTQTKPRTQTKGRGRSGLTKSDVSAPELDPDRLGPGAFAAKLEGEITGEIETQEFSLIDDRIESLHFTKPNGPVATKALFTVKAFTPDGRLIQVPFADQIQNTGAGDPGDAIGLRRAERKGHILLYDFITGQTIYCGTRDCWAKAVADGSVSTNYCHPNHHKKTAPNQFKDAESINAGIFGENATTSKVWNA